ncbi:hypothetical protein GCM10009641_48650 [Mycobacterium cookii]|uniref:Uncharacterized protein n=1 Tax=Mycobacterium cookii TaxID=1775 RepID=A0A7I7KX66_9MYCO|nr:hypothetical protein [Mycobacterium cookii]MCV7332891.1 hypothetical protein [Mycobacterium cookii]BBX46279.1 hypothetical protein MCOO_22940 [Mycobacterium cookii]
MGESARIQLIAAYAAEAAGGSTIVREGLVRKIARNFDEPTGEPDTAHLPPLRQHYIKDVRTLLPALEERLRAEGASEEQIAREMNALRRRLGEEYKERTPKELRHIIFARNIEKYGDPLGPSFQQLRDQGKTYAQIIEGAKRPGGDDLGLGTKK